MNRWSLVLIATAGVLLVLLLPGWFSLRSPGQDVVEGQHPIVAFGDSYTSGTGTSPENAYPALLEEHLGVPVANAGVHSQTAEEARSRLERDVLAHEPRLVIVEFGVNEAFRGYPVQRAIDGLDQLMAPIHQQGIPMVLVGVHFGDYQGNLDAGLSNLSERYDAGLVLDVLDGVLEDPEKRSDRYHPNAKGYAIMEQRIRPVVTQMLPANGTSASSTGR